MLRRLDYPTMRAAVWTLRALRSTRAQLRQGEIHNVEVPAPPALPETAIRGVRGVLRRRPNTCLERSLVLQRWLSRFGPAPDVVVGIAGTSERFQAHAWLDGDLDGHEQPFQELLRLPGATGR